MIINTSIYNRFSSSFTPDAGKGKPAPLFVFRAHEILMRVTGDGFDLPINSTVEDLKLKVISEFYLGKMDGCDCYCIEVDDQAEAPAGMVFKRFQALLGRIDEEIFLVAGRAYHLLNWDRKNRYCGTCGSPNEFKHDELGKVCPQCRSVIYPKISPAVIVAVTKGDKILLAHARHFKEDFFSLIAGFVEPGETFEDCVKREVFEEVGVRVKNIKYFGSQPWPFPDSLMVGFTADYESGEISVDGQEITSADWFAKDNLPNRPPNTSIAGRIISRIAHKPIIYFLCTGNSCRSQMAEGFAKYFGGDAVEVFSAGIETHGLNPRAVKVMAESGVDISNHTSDLIDPKILAKSDYVITLCGDANDNCPVTPPNVIREHWGLPDPARVAGTEEVITESFYKVRDEIKERVRNLLNRVNLR